VDTCTAPYSSSTRSTPDAYGATKQTVPAYVPALDPDSDTSDLSRPPQNPFPAVHPWRCSDTTADAHETRYPDPAVDSPPAVATLFPKRPLLAIQPGESPKTHVSPVAAQLAPQPATTEDTRAPQFEATHFHLQTVDGIGGNLAVVGKQTQSSHSLAALRQTPTASYATPLVVDR